MFNQLVPVSSRTCYGANIQTILVVMQENKEVILSELSIRFLEAMKTSKISGYKLKQDGVINSEPTLTKIKQGKQEPSKKTIKLFCSKYGINESWLYTGRGTMEGTNLISVPVKEDEGEFYTENNNSVKFYELGGKYRMVVKLVPFAAYGQFANECDTLEPEKDSWEDESFETDIIVHGKYYAAEVRGERMDNGTRSRFEEGERVLVRELDRSHWIEGLRFKDYPFWVVVFDSSVLIKQIVGQDLEKGTITFHSLNPSPEYSDFVLEMDKIRALYYVLQKKPKTVKY